MFFFFSSSSHVIFAAKGNPEFCYSARCANQPDARHQLVHISYFIFGIEECVHLHVCPSNCRVEDLRRKGCCRELACMRTYKQASLRLPGDVRGAQVPQ